MNNSSTLFLLLSNINNKIPDWLKIIFRLLFLSILIIKLLGFNVLDIISNNYYLKMYCYISCSLVILYQILNILLLYLFSKNNIKIPEILPDFIINWLKEFEIMSSSKASIKEFKTTCYIEILLYVTIIILITLILHWNLINANNSEIAQSISIFALLFNNIDNNNNNNNNKFKWFKIILRIVGFIIVFFSLFDFNTVLSYLMLIKFKWIIIINLIVMGGIILYNALSLMLLNLFTNNEINIPNYYPKFICNWLTNINLFSKSESKNHFSKIYKREIILYSLGFLFVFYGFIL